MSLAAAEREPDWPDDPPEPEDADPTEECGRWRNGSLAAVDACLSAGTEYCQMECPLREVK